MPQNDMESCVDLPSVHIHQQAENPGLPQLKWDLFKCSIKVEPNSGSRLSHSKTLFKYPVLTFWLEPRNTRHFLPPEGPECMQFSRVLQQVKNDVIGLLDPMIEPILS